MFLTLKRLIHNTHHHLLTCLSFCNIAICRCIVCSGFSVSADLKLNMFALLHANGSEVGIGRKMHDEMYDVTVQSDKHIRNIFSAD